MKHSKRILSLLLAALMTLGALPIGMLGIFATEPETSSNEWTDADYEALYVKDADGDGTDDRIFFWDAFDLTAEDGAVTALVNQLEGKEDEKIAISGTAGDGYVAAYGQTLNFSPYFQSFAKNVSYEGNDILVLQDATLELTMFQNTKKEYAAASSGGGTMSIAPLRDFTIHVYNSGVDGSSFVAQTYGVGARINPSNGSYPNVEVAFDTTTSWLDRSSVVFGNPRGADNTYSVAIRHDFDVPKDAIEGTVTLDFLRDGEIADNGKHATTYNMAYNALYRDNYKNTATPKAANNDYTFGGFNLDFAYRTIRFYDVALSDEQIKQNHAADLFKYYRLDISLLTGNQLTINRMYNELAEINIGDENAVEKINAALANKTYAEYYVADGLYYIWSGEDLAIGASEQAVSSLKNLLGGNLKINKRMYGRQYFNLASNDTNGGVEFNPLSAKIVDGGVIMPNDSNVILTDIIPYTVIDGVEVLTDMTLEISQSYFDTVATSTSKTASVANRGHDGGMAWYGPFGSIAHTKMTYNTLVVGSTRYYYAEYTDANGDAQKIYFTSTPKTKTNAKYTYENGVMTKITDEAVLDLIHTQANAKTLTVDGKATDLSGAGNNYSGFKPIDAQNVSGVQQHNAAPLSSYDKPGMPNFMNNTINEAFTSVMVFDYAAVAKQTTFNFALGRDGVAYNNAVTNKAYDATVDMSAGSYYTGAGGDYNGVTYTKNETFLGFVRNYDTNYAVTNNTFKYMVQYSIADEGRNFAFSYGPNQNYILHAIRVYNRVLTAEEQAQNHFVDIAMQLGVDLSAYYDKIAAFDDADEAYAAIHALTKGKDEGDFTKAELEEAIYAIYRDAVVPSYASLYVQDGLVYLWTGEDFELPETETKVNSLPNLLGGDLAIDKTTYGRQAPNLAGPSKYIGKGSKPAGSTVASNYFYALEGATPTFNSMASAGYYMVDGGVLSARDNMMILTDLLPTTMVGDTKVLTDMTLEVSQMYFDNVQISSTKYATDIGVAANAMSYYTRRGNDGGAGWFGPLGALSHAKLPYNAKVINGKTYYYLMYKDAEGALHPFYRTQNNASLANTTFYTYNEALNVMEEITDETVIARITEKSGSNMANLYLAEGVPYTSTTINANNMYATAPYYMADGTAGANISSVFTGYKDFQNNTINEAFTTSIVFDYASVAANTTYNVAVGRDGALLGNVATNQAYDATKDYSTFTQTYNGTTYNVGFIRNADPYYTVSGTRYYSEGIDDGNLYGFTYGVTLSTVFYAIRMYNRVLTAEEQAQNNFIDIAMKLDLDLYNYVLADNATKARIHALTLGADAGDFDAAELQTQVDLLGAGGEEYAEILDANVIDFNGYSIRVLEYAGLRAEFALNVDVIDATEANETVKIEEIGAIVAIKGDYALEDLTVAGGAEMAKRTVYKDGTFVNSTYARNGQTYFALTTTFENAESQTKEKYETELLYRGYMVISINGEDVVLYTNMEAPSYDKISMYDVTKVFKATGKYDDVQTIKNVLNVCEPKA